MFVCIVLMTTAIPIVKTQENSAIYATVPFTPPRSNIIANWTEMQKLLDADGAPDDNFGYAVSISGDTALIGARYDDDSDIDSGSACVFIRTGITWTQQQKLLAADAALGDYFGFSVALSGDTALIGAPYDDDNGLNSGSAYVFIRTGSTWTQQAKLFASAGAHGDNFGWSVSLDVDTAIIGAPKNDDNGDDSGAVYVFTRTGTTWSQQAKLLASDGDPYDLFGISIALKESTTLIGAPWNVGNGDYSGSAYVFTRSGTIWLQQAKLLASDGGVGDCFGASVSVDGDTAFIGAWCDADNGQDSGSAYVFTRTGTNWIQQQKLLASDGAAGDSFGYSVSLQGDTALVGAPLHDGKGTAYVFTNTGTTWAQQQKLLALDGAGDDWFACSVAFDGESALIGAYQDDDNGESSGSAYVFIKESGTPTLEINLWGGIGVNSDIKYNGTESSISVNWQIQVRGSILGLIHKDAGGEIIVQRGESRWVSTGLFLGVGPFTVIAKANDIEKAAKGIILVCYVIILI
jgi:hypothetical protein